MTRLFIICFAFGALLKATEYPSPLVREEQQVVVGGVAETWQLKWSTTPKPMCEPNEGSLTCPCTGFAYGEGGDLVLVRFQNKVQIDQLRLTPLFEKDFVERGSFAIIQRWQPDYDKDLDTYWKGDLPALAAKRPVVKVMEFGDYDHDGQDSEFYLKTTTASCGKNVGVVIGVSTKNPWLHVFGTASKPNEPLRMQKREWEALRHAKGTIEITDWPCGDHGAATETTLQLRWTSDGVDGARREFTCPPGPRRLIRETPL